MPPQRPSLFPPFAGVALADILANSVAIVIIMIVVMLMTRYQQEQEKLTQTEDVAVLLSRELASSFVMNSLPTSPPARLHDYIASPLDRNPLHSTMPIIELHDDFVRDHYTGTVYRRDELLRQDNAFDAYLASLTPAQLAAMRVDVYGIRQFYVAMSILKAHGHQPHHWHFLEQPGMGGGLSGSALALSDGSSLEAEKTVSGAGRSISGRQRTRDREAALPEDVSLAGTGSGLNPYPADAAFGRGAGDESQQEFFDLPGSARENDSGLEGTASDSSAAASRNISAGSSGSRFRAAGRPENAIPIATEQNLDMVAVLRGLFAFMEKVQAAADADQPSPLPRYHFVRDVLGIVPSLPAADRDQAQQLRNLVFLMETPREPDDDALKLRLAISADVRGQAMAVFPNEPLSHVRWLRDPVQPALGDMPEIATVTLQLGAHAEVHEGLRMPLARDALVLMPKTAPEPQPRWRVVTLVNAQRNDFVTGFLYAAVDDAGRLLLPVDENAVTVGGLRIESHFPALAFRGETRQLLFYGLIAALFAVGIVVRYWKP